MNTQSPSGYVPVNQMPTQAPRGGTGKSPKDWSPARPPKLLTKYERLQIAKILAGESVEKGDVDWLCRKVDMLARMGPEDFEFPEYAALVNPISCAAFAMRFRRGNHWREEVTLPRGELAGTHTLLDMTNECEVCDADLVVRPFVRLASTTTPEMVDEIRREKLRMEVDGEEVIWGSLDDHLVRPDGWPVRRVPYTMKSLGSCLFPAVMLDEHSEAIANRQYGIMAPNGSRIVITLPNCGNVLSRDLRLTTGLVAARYTTKAR